MLKFLTGFLKIGIDGILNDVQANIVRLKEFDEENRAVAHEISQEAARLVCRARDMRDEAARASRIAGRLEELIK